MERLRHALAAAHASALATPKAPRRQPGSQVAEPPSDVPTALFQPESEQPCTTAAPCADQSCLPGGVNGVEGPGASPRIEPPPPTPRDPQPPPGIPAPLAAPSVGEESPQSPKLLIRLHDVLGKVKQMSADKRSAEQLELRNAWRVSEAELQSFIKRRTHLNPTGSNVSGCTKDRDGMLPTLYEKEWYVINPDTTVRQVWDSLGGLLLCYSVIFIPMAVFNLPDNTFLRTMEYLNLVYWTFDVGASLVTGYYSKSELELNFKRIAMHYLKTWFCFDLFVLMMEYLLVIFDAIAMENKSIGLARTLRTARVLRALRYFRLLRLLRLRRLVQTIKERTNSEYVLLALAVGKLSFLALFLSHALACIWYGLGDHSQGWVHIAGINNKLFFDRYTYSLQFSLSRLHPTNMNSIFELNLLQERMWSIFATMNALMLSTVFVSIVTNNMAEVRRKRQDRASKLGAIREYVQKHGISMMLTMQLKRYIATNYTAKLRGLDEDAFLRVLPANLLMQLRHETWSPVVGAHVFFADLREKHLRTEADVCLRAVSEELAFDGDLVLHSGVRCSRMLFPTGGSFLYSPRHLGNIHNDAEEQRVEPGSWLCEASLWTTTWEARGDFRASENSALAVVAAEEFSQVVREHSSAWLDAVTYARKFMARLTEDRGCFSDLSVVVSDDGGSYGSENMGRRLSALGKRLSVINSTRSASK